MIEKIKEIRSQVEEKLDDAQRAIDGKDAEKATAIIQEIAELEEQITKLQEELASIESEELPESPEEEREDVEKLKGRIAELEKELEDKNEERNEESSTSVEENNTQIKGEKRNMTNNEQVIEEVISIGNDEQRSNFQNFVMNNEIRDLTTESGAVIVPEYIGTQVKDLTDEVVSLDKYVTVESVENKSGTKPVFKGDAVTPLATQAELTENPKLGVQPLSEIDYKVETYRGYIPVSREAIEDGIGAEQLVKNILSEAVVATRNAHILAVANTFETTEVADLDGLKDIVNVELKPKYKKHALMSQSVYNELDKVKDGNGRYMLQDSISAASGKSLFGMEVVVFEDALIGADTMYVGNFAEAIVLFDRSQYQAQWTMYMNFGEALMVAVRHQVKELNADGVRKIKFTPATSVEA